jgi:fibronectin type 3 domain-containing protein
VREVGKPLATVPPTETRYLDTTARFGTSYIYSVTALARTAPVVESAVQAEREVRYLDRFPPPAPADLVALAESGQVRLVWRSSEAADLAGYAVYRREGDGAPQRLTPEPIAALEFTDTDVAAGRTYRYRVTAIDQEGNESEPGPEATAVVP